MKNFELMVIIWKYGMNQCKSQKAKGNVSLGISQNNETRGHCRQTAEEKHYQLPRTIL